MDQNKREAMTFSIAVTALALGVIGLAAIVAYSVKASQAHDLEMAKLGYTHTRGGMWLKMPATSVEVEQPK